MAYLDHAAAAREEERIENFIKLKKFISSKDENGNVGEWDLAYEHICRLELILEKKNDEITKYKSFFSLLGE